MTCVLKPLTLRAALWAELRQTIGLGKTLSQEMLKVIGEPVEAEIAVPKKLEIEGLSSFRVGGVCSHAESHALLVRLAERHLRSGPDKALLFEDYMARADDEVMRATGGDWASFGDEVYHLLIGQVVSRDRIDAVLRRASDSVHTMGLLTGGLAEAAGTPRRLSRADLTVAVANATTLIIGVFDGESFIRVPLGRGHA